jgi:hypothetical protein
VGLGLPLAMRKESVAPIPPPPTGRWGSPQEAVWTQTPQDPPVSMRGMLAASITLMAAMVIVPPVTYLIMLAVTHDPFDDGDTFIGVADWVAGGLFAVLAIASGIVHNRLVAVALPRYVSRAPRVAGLRRTSRYIRAISQGQAGEVLRRLDILHGVPEGASRPWSQGASPVAERVADSAWALATRVRRQYWGVSLLAAPLALVAVGAVPVLALVLDWSISPLSVLYFALLVGFILGFSISVYASAKWARWYRDAVFQTAPVPTATNVRSTVRR